MIDRSLRHHHVAGSFAGSLRLGASIAGLMVASAALSSAAYAQTVDLAGANATINGLAGNSRARVVNTDAGAAILTLAPATGGTFTFNGLILEDAGVISLVKDGGGTQILNGASTYTGGTELRDGQLSFGNASALGSGLVTVTNLTGNAVLSASSNNLTLANNFLLTGDLRFTGTRNTTFSGTFSGAADLIVQGQAAFTNTNSSGFTGNIRLVGANILLPGSSALNARPIITSGSTSSLGLTSDTSAVFTNSFTIARDPNVVNSGLNFALPNGANTLTITGPISGDAPIFTKDGTGTLVLPNANAGFSGEVNIGTGFLAIGTSTSLGSGRISTTVASGLSTLNANLTLSNLIRLRSAFALDTSNGDNLTLTGSIINIAPLSGSIVKNGAGTATLTGLNTYTGPTIVNGGTLLIGAPGRITSDVTVNTGGTFGGTGTVAAANTVNALAGGAVAPGLAAGSVGTLTVGNLALATASNLAFDLGGNALGQSDRIIVSNNLNLNSDGGAGSLLNINALAGFGAGTYTLITFAGTLSNASGLAVGAAPAGFNYTIVTGGAPGAGFVNLEVILVPQQFWNGTTFAAVGAVQGGSGTWNSTNTNWTDVTGATAGAWAQNEAFFTVTPGTVTVVGGQNFDRLNFTVGGYLLQGDALTATGTATINTETGTTTINNVLAGTVGLTKIGAGELVLGGANSYTGGTTVSAGTVTVTNDQAFSGGAVAFADGTTLRAGNDGRTIANMLTLAGGLTIDTAAFTLSTTGAIGGGALTKIGSGTLVLGATNGYANGTTVTGGTLAVSGAGSLGGGAASFADGTTLQTAGGTFTLANAISATGAVGLAAPGAGDVLTLSGVISDGTGAGSVTKSGAGTIVLSGANSFTGPAVVAAGTLTLQGGAAIADGTTVQVDGGELNIAAAETIGALVANGGTTNVNASLTAGALSGTAGSIVLTAPAGLVAGSAGSSTSFGGVISGDGAFEKVGGGTLTFTGANSYTGSTTVTAGGLTLSGAGAIASTSISIAAAGALSSDGGGLASAASVANSGAFSLTNGGSESIANLSGSGSVALSENSVLTLNAGMSAISGVVSGLGSLTVAGTSSTTLSGANSYSGGTFINGGMLSVANDGNLGAAAGGVTFGGTGTGTLRFTDGTAQVVSARTISYGANGTIDTVGTADVVFSGVSSGSGGLTKVGTGTLTVSGAQGYAGATSVSAGTLNVTGSLASSAVTVADTAVLSGTGTVAGAVTVAAGGILRPGSGGVGVLTTGPLTLNGTAQFELGAANTIGGAFNDLVTVNGVLTVNGGVSVTQSAGGTLANGIYRLFNASGGVAGTGLTLDSVPMGFAGIVQTNVVPNQVNLVLTAPGTLVLNWDGADFTGGAPGGIDGGSGSWTLAGSNWTGNAPSQVNTNWQQGSVAVFTAAPGTVTLADVFSLAGAQFAVDGYTLNAAAGGELQFTSGAFVSVDNAGQTAVINAPITGANGFAKQGAGTLTLGGDSTYAGATSVTAGTLNVTGTIAGSGVSVSGATLAGNGTINAPVDIFGAGNLNPGNGGPGTLTLASLSIGEGSSLNYEFATPDVRGGATNDRILVGGALTFGGATLNVTTPGGTLAQGIYNVAEAGSVSGNLALGSLPTLAGDAVASINTTDPGFVNLLVVGTGFQQFWDGGAIANRHNNAVEGGDGTWSALSPTWATSNGALNANWQSRVGIFQGAAGTVTLEGAFGFEQLRFDTGGYVLTQGAGGALVLNGASVVDTNTAAADVTFFDVAVTGSGSLVKTGAGFLDLVSANDYSGGTDVQQGVVRAYTSTSLGSGNVALADGTGLDLVVNGISLENTVSLTGTTDVRAYDGVTATLAGAVSGSGTLVKGEPGTLVLTGTNSYQGGTVINAGTLAISRDANLGAAAGGVTFGGAATLRIDSGMTQLVSARLVDLGAAGATIDTVGAANVLLSTGVIGSAPLTKAGTGTLTLQGVNGYSGPTNVNQGTLNVTGSIVGTGAVTVASAATLAGNGSIAGPVTIASGGFLRPGDSGAGTLTTGSLVLNGTALFELGAANTIGGGFNDLVRVNGDLTLNGSVSLAQSVGGNLTAGVYQLFNYTGALLDSNLVLGTVPAGFAGVVQSTLIAGQVNLVVTAPGTLVLNWDAADGIGNGVISGGSGVWSAGAANWTGNAPSQINTSFQPGSVAVFAGAPGTVTLDGTFDVGGLQFAVDGYTLNPAAGGGALQFTAGGFISVDNAGQTATINAPINGANGFDKQGLGTLTLGGANGYTGATTVSAGTLNVTGSVGGSGVTVNGGASLTGTGTIAAPVSILTGGTLSPGGNLAGTLTVGALTLATGANVPFQLGQASAIAGAFNDHIVVNGDLTLASGSLLSVTESPGGLLTNGVYRLFTVSGAVTDNGLSVGLPTGFAGTLQANLIPGQVNLVITAPGTLVLFWDGADFVGGLPGGVNGGAGDWTLAGSNWTGVPPSQVNTNFQQGSVAVFATTGGAVNLTDSFTVAGLQFTTGGYTLGTAGAGELVLATGAFVSVDNAGDTATISAPVNGEGGLNKQGPGTLVLAGTNGYAGGTTISGGRLSVSSDANLGAAAGGVTFAANGNGTLGFTNTAAVTSARSIVLGGNGTIDTTGTGGVTLSGIVSGDGGLTKTGGDVLTLSGTNSYAGGTTIVGGTLSVASDANLGAAAGGVTFADGGNGTLRFTNTTAVTSARSLSLAGNGIISTMGTGGVTLTGIASGPGGLTKAGSDVLTLAGVSTFTGPTTVTGGRLNVTGSIADSATTVATGAMLSGTGTVGALTVQSGGTVNPGAAPGATGTLTVNGALNLAAGSTFRGDVTPAGADRITASGVATVAGNLVLAPTGTFNTFFQTFTLVSGSSRTGTFANATLGNYGVPFIPTLINDATSVQLQLRPASIVTIGGNLTGNPLAVATAFDRAVANGYNPQPFLQLFLQGANLSNALSQLSGELHSAERRVFLEQSRVVRETAFDRLNAGLSAIAGTQTASVENGEATTTVWLRGAASWQQARPDAVGSRFETEQRGVLTGVDYAVRGFTVGAMFHYTDTDVTFASLGRSNLDTTGGSIYAGYRQPDQGFAVGGGVSYAGNSAKGSRAITAPGLQQTLTSNISGTTLQLYGEAAFDFAKAANTRFEPFARIGYTEVKSNAFTETGGIAALTGAKATNRLTVLDFGLRGAFNVGGGFDLRASGAYHRSTGDLTGLTFSSITGLNSPAGIRAVAIPRDALAIEAQVGYQVSQRINIGVSYSAIYGGNLADNGVRATFSYGF